MYATTDDYVNVFLFGKAGTIPLTEFPFWSRRASIYIDSQTQNRLNSAETLSFHRDVLILVTCELAEAQYANESPDAPREMSSESVGGWSGSYKEHTKEQTSSQKYWGILSQHLGETGLLFRGVR